MHGTPDDIPLSPRRLVAEARAAGLEPELHAVTYTWRRMPPALQRALWPSTRAWATARAAARLGHTLMLIARRRGLTDSVEAGPKSSTIFRDELSGPGHAGLHPVELVQAVLPQRRAVGVGPAAAA